MKILKKLIVFSSLFLLLSCGVIKEGFENPKKKSSDEFLVEKKSPLVMPPEFDKLPVPDTDKEEKNSDNKIIKDLLLNSENNIDISNNDNSTNNSIENTVLEKIKKN